MRDAGMSQLVEELDAAIILGMRKEWTFTNKKTGQKFVLSLLPVEE